jgi:hypothetical protein
MHRLEENSVSMPGFKTLVLSLVRLCTDNLPLHITFNAECPDLYFTEVHQLFRVALYIQMDLTSPFYTLNAFCLKYVCKELHCSEILTNIKT